MATYFQTAIDTLVKNGGFIPPWLQDNVTKFAATIAPSLLSFGQREVSFERHPLQTLYHLLQKEDLTNLRHKLQELPEHLQRDIYYEVWSQATDLGKGGDSWGEHNALNHIPRLLNSIKTVVERKLDTLPEKKQHAVFGTIYRLANRPQENDDKWGEHHAKDDTERLIRALHRNQCLDMHGWQIAYYSDLEKDVAIPSQTCHLHRPELARGQICMINGMTCPFSHAQDNAYKLSDELAQGHNLYFTYSAAVNHTWDLASGILGQGGLPMPAVLELLEHWLDFFETDEDNYLLQLCTSRGAIEVHNALCLLPEEKRLRIIVIAIAPACLIPQEIAHKVVNLIILSDPIIHIASNRHLLNASYTLALAPHRNTLNPHDMFGSSYMEQLAPMIDSYIRTNDI